MCTFLNFLNFFILHFSELCSNFTAILGFWLIVDFFYMSFVLSDRD